MRLGLRGAVSDNSPYQTRYRQYSLNDQSLRQGGRPSNDSSVGTAQLLPSIEPNFFVQLHDFQSVGGKEIPRPQQLRQQRHGRIHALCRRTDNEVLTNAKADWDGLAYIEVAALLETW